MGGQSENIIHPVINPIITQVIYALLKEKKNIQVLIKHWVFFFFYYGICKLGISNESFNWSIQLGGWHTTGLVDFIGKYILSQ